MGANPAPKRKRIEARVTAEEKALVQRAAALTGSSVTDFVMRTALQAAAETIRSHQVVRLALEDSATFAAALLEPPEPEEKLRALARRYREFVGE